MSNGNTMIDKTKLAFPIGSGDMRDQQGMALRDYFAAKVMQAMMTFDSSNMTPIEKIACWAYESADAMLKAREVP